MKDKTSFFIRGFTQSATLTFLSRISGFMRDIFIAAFLLFDGQIITHPDLYEEILFLLIITPIIHRLVNILGFKLGLKDVPY